MQGIPDALRAQCQLIAEQARAVTGSPRAVLLLYDEPIRRLVTVATTGADLPLQQVALDLIRRNYPGLDPLDLSYRPTINRVVADAFIGQRTQISTMPEAFKNIFPAPVSVLARGLVGITHVVTCPVADNGRPLGLARFLVAGPPSESQVALMEAAANQISLTIANASLAEQVRRHLAATRAMAEVARLGASQGGAQMLSALADRSRQLIASDAAVIYLVEPDGKRYRPVAESFAEDVPDEVRAPTAPVREVGDGIVGWVIAAGEAAFVPDSRVDPRSRKPDRLRFKEAVIATPMRVRGSSLGCLRLSALGRRRFTEADLWLAQTLADEAGLVLETAREQEEARAAAYAAGRRDALRMVKEPQADAGPAPTSPAR